MYEENCWHASTSLCILIYILSRVIFKYVVCNTPRAIFNPPWKSIYYCEILEVRITNIIDRKILESQ